MPTYGYECKSCGHAFDVFQRMSDDPLKVCPQCSGELRRLINGGTGVIFRGSGFYLTDKKSAPPPATAAKDAPKPKDSSGSAADTAGASCAKADSGSSGGGSAENKAAG